ncbi:hypothetical protein RSJ42_04055 [Methanosarcina hadiensis]|uniref:hypothetical protein n=1 Tax=Methanosarcina hadiensis TaxID=3078083 RepID=UPI003977327E
MDFSPEDRAWLDNDPDIKFGSKELGSGGAGIVYELDNNPDLVIKVPKRFIPYTDTEKMQDIDARANLFRVLLLKEIETYNKLKKLKIIIPTRVVKLGVKTADGEDYLGLVRPKLKTSLSDLMKLSDEQLLEFRENLVELSEAGYEVAGWLQVGVDRLGKVQIYDIGDIKHCEDKKSAYTGNDSKWYTFLYCTEKVKYFFSDPSRIKTFFKLYKLY